MPWGGCEEGDSQLCQFGHRHPLPQSPSPAAVTLPMHTEVTPLSPVPTATATPEQLGGAGSTS